jgi:hypothetical protein
VTKEQLIVLGFIAAAFVVGWITRALTGDQSRGQSSAAQADGHEHSLTEARQAPDRELGPHAVTAWTDGPASSDAADRDLREEVSDALRSDTANQRMLDAVSADRQALTDLELDLADWGFTYGVAWARANERADGGPGDHVAREALSAAKGVFSDYTRDSDWTQPVAERLSRETERSKGRPTRSAGRIRRSRLFRS